MQGDVSKGDEVEQGKAKMAGVRDRGELHVHLNGAIPVPIIREILADEATELPPGFLIERDLLRNTTCQSLASYLTPWQALRLFPKKRENLDRISNAVFARLVENASAVPALAIHHIRPSEPLPYSGFFSTTDLHAARTGYSTALSARRA